MLILGVMIQGRLLLIMWFIAIFLKNQGLHILVGMIRCCLEDAREEHFKVIDVIISDAQKNVGIDEYTKFGATSTKITSII
jgi:hypothetical protein